MKRFLFYEETTIPYFEESDSHIHSCMIVETCNLYWFPRRILLETALAHVVLSFLCTILMLGDAFILVIMSNDLCLIDYLQTLMKDSLKLFPIDPHLKKSIFVNRLDKWNSKSFSECCLISPSCWITQYKSGLGNALKICTPQLLTITLAYPWTLIRVLSGHCVKQLQYKNCLVVF